MHTGIFIEILQKIQSIKEYAVLREYFDIMPIYHLKYGKDVYG